MTDHSLPNIIGKEIVGIEETDYHYWPAVIVLDDGTRLLIGGEDD